MRMIDKARKALDKEWNKLMGTAWNQLKISDMEDMEREAKEKAKKLKVDQEQTKEDEEAKDDLKQATYSGSDEEKSEETSAMDEDDLPFAEPVRELPREVRGILVLARGKKPKRSIVWRPENSLVEVKYFEMEEGERENVWKTKSFEEMRKQELAR